MAPKNSKLTHERPVNLTARVPRTVFDWKTTAKQWGAAAAISQLGSQEKVKSASKFDFKHFLGLRVIYVFGGSRLPPSIAKQFPLPQALALNNLPGWNAYLNEINTFSKTRDLSSCIPKDLGPMVNVWQFQQHVLRGDGKGVDLTKISVVSPAKTMRAEQQTSPTVQRQLRLTLSRMNNMSISGVNNGREVNKEDAEGESDEENTEASEHLGSDSEEDEGSVSNSGDDEGSESNPGDDDPSDGFYTPGVDTQGHPIKDEQTVNVFLLAFLSAITATIVPFHTRWLADRNAMIFQKRVRYVARTDGYLRGENSESYSLIEVKPRKRGHNIAIRVQESAQMAAWISQSGTSSHNPMKDCRYLWQLASLERFRLIC